jgi:hypothetical protein
MRVAACTSRWPQHNVGHLANTDADAQGGAVQVRGVELVPNGADLAICCLALALDSWCNHHTYLVRDATERVLHGTKCILVEVSCTSRISIEPQAQSMSKPAIRNRSSSSSSSREWEISARHVESVRIAAYACVMGRSRCYAAARCSTSSSHTLRRIWSGSSKVQTGTRTSSSSGDGGLEAEAHKMAWNTANVS